MTMRRAKILAVDDAPANLKLLAGALRADYELALATSGAQALEIALAEPLPDLILLDVMMPEMDGYEVCRRLKADERTAEIPVIFVTSLADADDEAKGLELGAIDYITKPFTPAIVLARVRNHLALREAIRMKQDVERIMIHDLKSPLTTIISLPQLLLMDGNLEEPQRDMLRRIEDSGYTLLSMINLTTALYKMECGEYRMQKEKFDLLAVARKLLSGLEDAIATRRLALGVLVGGKPAGEADEFTVAGEELLCHSMLGNLISNAVEASPEGGVLQVEFSHREGGAAIEVRNHGAVPPDMRQRFFEKYATSGKTRGTGLGTYSARLIAQAHGGDISMRTDEATGTAVTVTLPAV